MRGVAGFRFAGISAGIKSSGAPDIGLMVADRPAASAAVFTKNRVAAAPVKLSRRALVQSGGKIRAVVVNSGNANALTGPAGARDARTMQSETAQLIDVPQGQVLVASTGVIGVPLPMERVSRGIGLAHDSLRPGGFGDFSRAILTTDRAEKLAKLSAGGARFIGCTKGAGMIAPNMATTLTFVATDAQVSPANLQLALDDACAVTYNAITVDGDTSTNDMILVMASGTGGRLGLAAVRQTLSDLLGDLARQLMRGGEGVHHVVTIEVVGARSNAAARRIARTVATSPLVKTAIAGADPNFGRILAAAGNAGVPIRQRSLSLAIGKVVVVEGGVPVVDGAGESRASQVMQKPDYTIRLDLGMGQGKAHHLACDLSHEYVTINADYRT